MKAHVSVLERGERIGDLRLLRCVEAAVHQTSDRTPDQAGASDDNVGGDRERDQRVEQLPARESDGDDGDQDAGRGPHVGHEVLAIGFEHDRALPAPCGE